MKTYYIVFETNKSKNFRIRTTNNNLDSVCGLINEIERLEKELNTSIVITYWKKLNKFSWNKIFKW